jgi:hypothetical protein
LQVRNNKKAKGMKPLYRGFMPCPTLIDNQSNLIESKRFFTESRDISLSLESGKNNLGHV